MTERKPLAPHPTLRQFYESDAERQDYINDLFDKASKDYDWVNGLLSFGSGYWYRGEVLRRAGLTAGMSVIDVATGTGPVAVAAQAIVGNSGRVVGVDPSGGMLRVARTKVDATFVQAVGEALAVRSDTFDMLTMGYALRHVADLRTAFTEYRRVLKPGGQLAIMEISLPRSTVGRALLGVYMGTVAPIIARVGRNRDTAQMMRYYWATTATCVAPAVILDALRDVGFREVRRELRYGMLADYRAAK